MEASSAARPLARDKRLQIVGKVATMRMGLDTDVYRGKINSLECSGHGACRRGKSGIFRRRPGEVE